MLSHYDAVVWYTGDDIVTRTPGRAGGNADRLALDEMLEFRAYMNEGGKVLYTGDVRRSAVHRPTSATSSTTRRARSPAPRLPAGVDPRRCLALRGSGDGTNDVLQYCLRRLPRGAPATGIDENGDAVRR